MAGLQINVSYDPSVTALQTSNPTLYAQYTSAVQTAVNYFQNAITTPITVNISFGWGEVGGSAIGAGSSGESSTFQYQTTYAQLLAQAKVTLNTSPVQVTALATLPATDPTSGAVFSIATAEATALGFNTAGYTIGGSAGLNSSSTWAWTQNNIPAGATDAIGTLEHEISEVLGRSDSGGKGGQYTLLDMFRYTALDGQSTDTIGAAAGVRDQPFVNGYNVNAPSYFSYNGSTVTLLYETPANVAGGADVGDWAPSVPSDSFGDASTNASPDLVSPTDLTEMNVLGYALGNTGSQLPSPPTFVVAQGTTLNTVSTASGANLPTPVSGDFNLEQVTSPSGTTYPTPSGYQGVALVSGRSFNLLHGNYGAVDTNSGGGDTIIGGDGNDTINALVGNDVIAAGSGNATVFGAAGDVINDPSGNTYFAFSGGTNAIVLGLAAGAALLYGGASDSLVGGAGAATAIGTPNDNWLLGSGNDTINAIPTGETVTFGTGNATVYGGIGDTIGDAAGTLITVNGGSNAIVLAGSGNSVLLYSGPGDTLTGGNAPVTIIGAASDNISLGTGADTVNALPTNETITFGTGNATVFGGVGDTIGSAAGTNVIFNGGNNPIVVVSTAGSVVVGSAPTDTLTGGTAAAQIIGTANDTITLGAGADTVNALAGNQAIILGNAAGAGTVYGASGDAFTTGMGSDYVDFINGHAGTETLAPGSGNDTVAQDTVANFNQAQGDRILETGTAQTNTLTSAHQSGTNTVFTLSDGSTVTLAGITSINSSFFA